ncbi:MAG TPA: hypothetical protein PKD90_08525 [Phnomibacter sp.]|nr:hypothetical protein [Phnomibacter sp.]
METIQKLVQLITTPVLILLLVLLFRKSIGAILRELSGMMGRASKFSLGKDGLTFEERLREIAKTEAEKAANQAEVQVVQALSNQPVRNADVIVTTLAPGHDGNINIEKYKYKELARLTPAQRDAIAAGLAVIEDDPQKLKWGGKHRVGNRLMTGSVKSLNSWLFMATVQVQSTSPQTDPLTGTVTFHLHPTFPDKSPVVPVVEGKAIYSMICYGSFTVGAEVDSGTTLLELDLAELPDVPTVFKEL